MDADLVRADGAVAVDVGVDHAGKQARGLVDQGEVFLLRGVFGELGDERVVGLVGLREDDDAGGLAVEAMHDAGAGRAAGRGELALGVMERCGRWRHRRSPAPGA